MIRRTLLGLGLILALSLPMRASESVTYEQLTIAATAVGISTSTLNPSGQLQPRQCQGVLETAAIRYRFDGTAPTATVGTPMSVADVLNISNPLDAARIRFIRSTGTSGTLNLHCWY